MFLQIPQNVLHGINASTDHAVVRFDGVTGKIVEDSTVVVDDNGDILLSKDQDHIIQIADGLSAGRSLTIRAGNYGDDGLPGGDLNLYSGNSGASVGGNINIITGVSDSSGAINIKTGDVGGATSGDININVGNSDDVTFGVINIGTLYASAINMGVIKTAGYKSSDGSTGISTTITTASLVGKTITIKNGIITGFA